MLSRHFRYTSPALLILVFVALIVLDQTTKALILRHFHERESVAITPFFNIVLVFNTGAAFSFLANAGGWQHFFFVAVAIIASIFMLWMLYKSTLPLEKVALNLILSGAIGNLVDRLRIGKVVDFLDFHLWGYHWPAFNVADSAISTGVVLMLWLAFVPRKAPIPMHNQH